MRILRYSEDQPRDNDGRFSGGESGFVDPEKVYGHAVESMPQGKAVGAAIAKLDDGDGSTEQLPSNSLIPTQDYTGADKVAGMAEKWDAKKAPPILVVRVGSKNYIYDGHHRAAAAIKNGDATIKALVATVKEGRALRYSPDQPRDDHGRFGEGTSDTVAGNSFIKDMELLNPAMSDHEMKAAIVRNEARRQGYPVDKIDVKQGAGRVLEIAGHNFNEGGNANLQTGVITMFPDVMPDAVIGPLLAHEIEHERYQTVLDAYKAEGQHLSEMAQHDHEGFDKITDPAGWLDPSKGAYAQFPNQTALQPIFQNIPQLIKEDGVTAYSKAYWEAHEQGKVTFDLAVHETLAEMARMKYGKEEYAKGDKPTKLWRELYKQVSILAKEQGFGKKR